MTPSWEIKDEVSFRLSNHYNRRKTQTGCYSRMSSSVLSILQCWKLPSVLILILWHGKLWVTTRLVLDIMWCRGQQSRFQPFYFSKHFSDVSTRNHRSARGVAFIYPMPRVSVTSLCFNRLLVSAPLAQYTSRGRGQIFKCSTSICSALSVSCKKP